MDHFFTHNTSHYVGREVWGADLGLSSRLPVPEGKVFTIEPGLYIPSEKIGIRIEDDFLMTKNGPVNINPNLPKTVAAIEAFMAANNANVTGVQNVALGDDIVQVNGDLPEVNKDEDYTSYGFSGHMDF